MSEEGWMCFNSWRESNTEIKKLLKQIEDSLEQDGFYGLEDIFREIREYLEEPF